MGTLIPPVAGNDLQWQKNPSKTKVLLASPLRLTSGATRTVGFLIKNGALTPLSALGYTVASVAHGAFKTAALVVSIAESAETTLSLTKSAKEISEALIDANMQIRQERQEKLQSVANGAKIINFVPVVGPIIANSIDAAVQIAALEAKAERAVSWGAKHYVRAVFEFLRCTAPTILRTAHKGFHGLDTAALRLKKNFHTALFHSDTIADTIDALADRQDALRWKLTHSDVDTFNEKKLHREYFKKLGSDAQNDLLFAVLNALSIHPTREQKSNFCDAVRFLQKGSSNVGIDMALDELLSLYDRLQPREKHRVTPADVRCMDHFEKLKALKMVREHPEKLSHKDRTLLAQFNDIFKKDDLQVLAPEEIKQLEALIVTGLLHLPSSDLSSLLDLTEDELGALSHDEQLIVYYLATTLVSQKGKIPEVVRLELLSRKNAFSQKDHQVLCSMLQKYLTAGEKSVLIGALKTPKLKISPENIAKIVHDIQNNLKHAKDAEPLQNGLQILQEMTTEVDMESIMKRVGPDVQTSGYMHKALSIVGGCTSQVIKRMDFSPILNKTASAIDILMILPYGKNLLASLLSRSGVPVYKVEAMMANFFVQTAAVPFRNSAKNWFGWLNVEALKPLISKSDALHDASLNTQSSAMSKQCIETLSSIWKTTIKRAAQNEPFAKFVGKIYADAILPSLKKTLSAAESAYKINAANYKLFQSSMDIGLQAELQAQGFLHDKAKLAHEAARNSPEGSLNQKLLETVSWTLPLINWLTLSSNSLIVIPFLVQRVLPHTLRAVAQAIGPSFWQKLAKDSEALLIKGAKKLSKTGRIDPLRIDGFKQLTDLQKQHLFDLAKVSPNEFKVQDVLIYTTLERLDRLDVSRPAMTLKEFFALTQSEQQEIFFTVAHSRRYKHFRDTNADSIVRKYSELEKQPIRCFSADMYRKLTVNEQEAIRLSIARNLHLLDQVVGTTIEEEHEWQKCMQFAVPEGWELEQYRALGQISNMRLQTVLKLYAALNPEEKQIFSPAKLSRLGSAKIKQALTLLDRYKPQALQKYGLYLIEPQTLTVKQKERTRFLERLASCIEMLSVKQKSELLTMTSSEFEEMDNATKQTFTLFISQYTTATHDIVKVFNRLDKAIQASWYDRCDAQVVQNLMIHSLIVKECDALKAKMQVIEKRIAKLTDSKYMALGYQINAKTGEDEAMLVDLESKKAVAKSLETVLSGMKLRSHASKEDKLNKLVQEISDLEKRLAANKQQIFTLTEQQKKVSDNIMNLEQLKYECQQKLLALSSILGIHKPEGYNPQDIPEAPMVTKAIEAVVEATVSESCKSIQEALIHNVQKHSSNTVPVKINDIDVGSKAVIVDRIEISNAQGSALPKAFSAETITIGAPLMGYLKDEIVIDEMLIDNVYISLEAFSPTNPYGNWTKILGNLQNGKNAKPAKDEKPGKKVVIKKLRISKINVDFAAGPAVKHLPEIAVIELSNISSDESIAKTVLQLILRQVLTKKGLSALSGVVPAPGNTWEKVKGMFSK